MTRVKQVVDWALSRNLTVVLNFHHENWLYPNYAGGMTNFTNMWHQVAAEFAGEPSNLIFEVLNEPQGNMSNAQVNDMNTKVLAIIRGSGGYNGTRWVIIGADSYNAFNRLTDSSFVIPTDSAIGGPFLIANFHYYNHWNFCGNAAGTWGTASDKSSLASDLLSVSNWAASKGIPVYMGEYGAADGCDMLSRWAWYDAICADANSDGFAYVAWDDFGNQATSFQIFHRTQGTFDQNILNAIF
jgi:endoglucanase